MKHLAAAAAGAAITLAILTRTLEPKTVYRTEVIERTRTEQVLTTIDLEELKGNINELDKQLKAECILVIERHSGDPIEGIRHHVERHYAGDACKAADEAVRGQW